MAANNDSRPFAVIRQHKKEFIQQFESDVQLLNGEFNSKLSALLREPDAVQAGSSRRLSASIEFSKAKLEIYVEMKKLVEKVSNEWGDKLQDMMSTYLENVEIMLAKTALSVPSPTARDISRTDKKLSLEAFKGLKSLTSSSSSIYPTLLNTAKHIPVLGSLLPKDDEEDEETSDDSGTPSRQIRRSPKQVTIVTPDEMAARYTDVGMESSDSESEEEPPPTPMRRKSSVTTTPLSQSRMPLKSSLRKTAMTNSFIDSNANSGGRSSLRSRVLTPNDENRSSSSSDDTSASTPTRRKGRKSVAKEVSPNKINKDAADDGDSTVEIVTSRRATRSVISNESVSTPDLTPGRNARRRKLPEGTSQVSQKASRNAEFSVGLDIHDDLEIYSPDVALNRSVPRRKTAYELMISDLDDVSLTPATSRTRGKRKTMTASLADETVAPSPKRLKKGGGRNSFLPPAVEELTDNLLDSDGADEGDDYSSWLPLSDVGPKIPAHPGIYELKVSAAKKSAYIGACDSLRQKLTLHKLKGNSGHKHLDKFIERNASNVQVRFVQLPSLAEAKEQEKVRVKAFVSQYKTTPAYN